MTKYGNGMTVEDGIDPLNAWLAKAGLRGEPEAELVSGFCERAVAVGLPVGREPARGPRGKRHPGPGLPMTTRVCPIRHEHRPRRLANRGRSRRG